MKSPTRLTLAVLPLLASVANAHPGHDGHELTWDLGHLVQHPVWLGVGLAVAAGISWIVARSLRQRLGRER